jgi:glycosyltransferase involved in cell wall biosynthesis
MIKVLYLFSGSDRRELEAKVDSGQWPDNWFYGYKQLERNKEFDVSYFQVTKENFKGNFLLFFTLCKKLREAEVIFITSSLHLSLLRAKAFGLLRKKKWLILNLDLTNKIKQTRSILRLLKQADKVICLSQSQIQSLKSRGLSKGQLESISFGIDLNFYQPLKLTDHKSIIAIGRDAGRDYGTLIEALKDHKETVTIVSRAKNLLNLVIPTNFQIIEEKTPLETREYYEESMVSVVPSFAEESGLGSDCSGQTVILESMAYGRPVVATRRSWMKDYFTSGQDFLLVPPGEPVALQAAIYEVLGNSELRERLIANGRKLVETRYNSESMGNQIAQIILGSA